MRSPRPRCVGHPAIAFRSTRVARSGSAWTVQGLLTVKGRPEPFELTVTDVTADGTALVIRATGTVDRFAHGVTMMPGMAARRLSVEVTARDASLTSPTARRLTRTARHQIDKLGGTDFYTPANAYQLVESLRTDYGQLGSFGIHLLHRLAVRG